MSIINLRKGFNRIRSQGYLGSSSAFAAAAILEYIRNRTDGTYERSEQKYYSPRFIYYNNRLLDFYNPEAEASRTCPIHPNRPKDTDRGSRFSWTKEALKEHGCCNEEDWQYMGCERSPSFSNHSAHFDNRFADTPDNEAYEKGIAEFRKYVYDIEVISNDPDKWIKELKQGNPIYFGIVASDGFCRANTEFFSAHSGRWRGGHAVVVIGHDPKYKAPDGKQYEAFLLRNSWGHEWGENGYVWINVDTLVNSINNEPMVFRSKRRFKPFPKPDAPEPAPTPPEPMPGPTPTPTSMKGEFMYQWWWFTDHNQAKFCHDNNISPNTLNSRNLGQKLDGPVAGLGNLTDGINQHGPRPGNAGNFRGVDPAITSPGYKIVALGACRIKDLPRNLKDHPESADGYWKWVLYELNRQR